MPSKLVANRVADLGVGTYTDLGQTGLQLRVRPKKGGFSRTWLLRFKFRGQESRIALGHFPDTTIEVARGLARRYREHARQGLDPRRVRSTLAHTSQPGTEQGTDTPNNPHSIEFLAQEFLERHVKVTRNKPDYAERIIRNEVLTRWAGRDAHTIKPREVIGLLDGIVARGSRVMANRVAGLLGQMFKFGIHHSIVETTPVQLLYRPGGAETSRERVLSDNELSAFVTKIEGACSSSRTAHILMLLLLTGQRRGELAVARWIDIDPYQRTWLIPDENNKARSHVVPLSAWALKEFKELKKLAGVSRFVFPNEAGSAPANAKLITRSVARSQESFERIGVKPFTPQDLRRTARAGLARLKIEAHITDRLFNRTQRLTQQAMADSRHLDQMRTALEQWATHLQTMRG